MTSHSYVQSVWQYLKRHKGLLVLALALATINQVFSLLDPFIFRIIIDDYATKYSEYTAPDFFRGVGFLLLLAIGAALVSRIAKNFQDYFVSVISQRTGTQLYARSVGHTLSLDYALFEDQRSGEILQKMQKAKTDMQGIIASFVNTIFLSAVGLLFVMTYAFFTHWMVGMAFLISIPIVGISTFFISRRIKAAQKKVLAESTELAGLTTETLRNIELVKSLGLEKQEIRRLNQTNDKILDLELKKIKLVRTLSFFQGTIINLTRSTLLLLMFSLIFRGELTIGAFFTLMIYSFFIFGPLAELGHISSQYQESKASYEQLETILKLKPSERKGDKDVGPIDSMEFKGVCFTYPTSDIASVNDISLSMVSGKTYAFVGPSGAGKSTMVKLLVGLYEPTKGTLLINEVNSKQVDHDIFRKRVGLVSQETQLFAGTIRENLLFVNPAATDAECLEAIRLAAAEPIINRGGKGLDTKIGEGGIKISGGERQRIAIARALLRNPDLMIFDEATSALDSITEKAITSTIKNIIKSRPHLIIALVAHRLSTVAHADIIFVLEKGKIAEQGSHKQLLEKKGLYEAFWKEQTAESRA